MSDQDNNAEDEHNEFRDRRGEIDLRLIFVKACEITAPFFDGSKDGDDASLALSARQTLCEAYPELTQQEVTILYAGVVRHHRGLSAKTDDDAG